MMTGLGAMAKSLHMDPRIICCAHHEWVDMKFIARIQLRVYLSGSIDGKSFEIDRS